MFRQAASNEQMNTNEVHAGEPFFHSILSPIIIVFIVFSFLILFDMHALSLPPSLYLPILDEKRRSQCAQNMKNLPT